MDSFAAYVAAAVIRVLASGSVAYADAAGRVLAVVPAAVHAGYVAAEEAQADEGPTCSICDGVGHGYPGGGPCPLEMRGNYDGEPEWAI